MPARYTDRVIGPNGPAEIDHYASADYQEALNEAGVVVIALNTPGMTDNTLCAQVGLAVMQDKPIIVVRCEAGLITPRHLCEVAFDVVEYHPDPDEQTKLLGKAMRRLAEYLRSE